MLRPGLMEYGLSMSLLQQEYDLFKQLCRHGSCAYSAINGELIQSLQKKGLKISRSENEYRLSNPPTPLAEDIIFANLDDEYYHSKINHLVVLYETESTNKEILEYPFSEKYNILVAESQTKGQGRRNKEWFSPLAENLYFSLSFSIKNSKNINFLPLLTAMSVCKSLYKIGINGCQLKWPNDIYLKGKKLGGILLECRYNEEKGHSLVVGIGLNVNMKGTQAIEQSWTSLFLSTDSIFNRNTVVSMIIADLIKAYSDLNTLDKAQFLLDWQALDILKNRCITINEDGKEYRAIARGLAGDGSLIVELKKNKNLQRLYAADVSLTL